MNRAVAPAISMDPKDSAVSAGTKRGAPNGSKAISSLARPAFTRPVWFWLLMGYFVLEYIRPPYIVDLRLQLVIIGLLLIGWVRQPNRPWSRNLTLQTAFLALCLLSVTYSLNRFSAYVEARTMFGNVAIALAVTWLMARRRDFIVGIWFWIATMSFQAIHAVQYDGFGTGGFVGDDNDVAFACCIAIPFALQGAAWFRGWRRWVSGGLSLLFTAAIVSGTSRGGFIGLLALVAYGIVVSRNRIRNLAIGAAAAFVFYAAVPESYQSQIASISENKEHDTGEARFFLWTAAWNMWLDHPVVGVGGGNFNWNVGHYQAATNRGRFASREYVERDWTMTAAHSLYLTLLSETGLVGSLVFCAIIVGYFSTLRRLRKDMRGHASASPELRRDASLYGVGLSMAMVGCLTAGAFLSVAYYPYVWFLGGLAVAWDRAVRGEISDGDSTESSVSFDATKG